jgi:nucleotide-binding universal stress UspA family protein
MTAPQRILVLVDGDRPAGAFERAAALAAQVPAELLLLGVDPPPLDEAPSATVLADGEANDRAHRRAVCDLRDRLPASVRSRVIFGEGPAGPATVDAAVAEAADLVVIPIRRGGELAHLLHDGTPRHVLHHSPVPVLVVPEG